jgi:superfamily II DNA or RNA helicase
MNDIFEPKLKWNSSDDDLVDDFFKHAMKNCSEFQLVSDFSFILKLIPELMHFINQDVKIQLIINLESSSIQKDISQLDLLKSEKFLSDFLLELIKTNSFELESLKILGQILTMEIEGESQLKIKIAIPKRISKKSHLNIGVFHYENGEQISISGETDESNSDKSIENFTAYTSWGLENDYNVINQSKFSNLWDNNSRNLIVYDFPDPTKMFLANLNSDSITEPKTISENSKKDDISIPTVTEFQFFDHQKEAIKSWISNDMCGLFEMATGTGKTITAFGCISELQKLHNRTVIVIACPYKHLVEQWKTEFDKFNSKVDLNDKISFEKTIICNGDYPKWKVQFNNMIFDFNEIPLGGKIPIMNQIIIFITHDTLASPDFISRLEKLTNTKKFLIIDEVHEITENRSSKVLLDEYEFRLGLSATPNRHMDEEGTQILKNYFHSSKCFGTDVSDEKVCKNCSKKFIPYSLDLKKAIHDLHVLCEYEYYPYYVELTSEEMSIYIDLSMQIARLEQKRKKGIKLSKKESYPYLARANLIANAENKDNKLEEILNNEFKNHLQRTLIYCTNTRRSESDIYDLPQLERVKKILFSHKIKSDSVTHHDLTKLRLEIISELEGGILDCITAVGCLDQGVDIPSVENAIIMASTGNPKQYIQRRGRILRKSKLTNKEKAFIYDILVAPPLPELDEELRNIERKIFAKELLRHKEFAKISNNEEKATSKMKIIAKKFNLDFDRLDHDYIKNELL